ncbi:MAG: hypothetical protein A3F72_03025 [Bacteroidetes bacterium RIFCSPLOWO2_12_FULL_35_15]|nr:MAG: hypothetical protein A3F72_03025 [Bacteroidetes bacterium RIFCSPLOWO2_12_FULL_35_15]
MFTASIPAKPYVRKHIENCFGTPALMRRDSAIGKYFYQLVGDPKTTKDKRIADCNAYYSDLITVKIVEEVFLRKGCVLTKTNIVEFNRFVECHLKMQMRIMIDTLMEIKKIKKKEAILFAYDKFNMDETVLPYETIKKDYYRHEKGLEPLVSLI